MRNGLARLWIFRNTLKKQLSNNCYISEMNTSCCVLTLFLWGELEVEMLFALYCILSHN